MDLEVRHLRLVRAVADAGSLTRAGDQLHLTQSALSHQLRDIESRLSTPLFLRMGKRLVLTPAGARLLESARDVLGRLEATEQDVRRLGTDGARLLRLTTECYTCYHWLPQILVRYRRRFPGVEVRIDVDATAQPLPALLEGTIDVAVMSCVGRVDRRLTLRPIMEDELVVVMAPGHRLASNSEIAVSDFEGETLFIYPPRRESTLLQEVLLPAGVVPHVQEIVLTEAILELVRAGLGVAALARWAVGPSVDAGHVVARPLATAFSRRQWSAVMLKETARVDYVAAFVELLALQAPRVTAGRGRRAGNGR